MNSADRAGLVSQGGTGRHQTQLGPDFGRSLLLSAAAAGLRKAAAVSVSLELHTIVSNEVANVRYWHKADIPRLSSNVRFRG